MKTQETPDRNGANATDGIVSVTLPGFLRRANEEYRAGNAHVFVLHGNVNDYQENQGRLASLRQLMMAACDHHYTAELLERKGTDVEVQDTSQRGLSQTASAAEAPKRICAIYVANEGLRFDSDRSRELFSTILQQEYEKEIKNGKMRTDFVVRGHESYRGLQPPRAPRKEDVETRGTTNGAV
jgi:hypothetical protein